MTLPHALDVRGLTKRFGATQALSDGTITIEAGEIHGLVGENGSGKSTLVKILTGFHTPDGGDVRICGSAATFPVRPDAHPVAVVHQDLGLVLSISVLENIVVTDGFGAAGNAPIPWTRLRAEVQALLDRLRIAVRLDALVGSLTRAEQALVGIARALRQLDLRRAALSSQNSGSQASLIILDEPTASLSSSEAELVFATLRTIASQGGSALYISHKLMEVVELCDRVTVFRDGRTVAVETRAEMTTDRLVAHMLGARPEHLATERDLDHNAAKLLEVENISGGAVHGISFSVGAGHILGITGLVGMGQDDVPYLISGGMEARTGSVRVSGADLSTLTIEASQQAKLFVVPADRRGQGLWVEGTAAENLELPRERNNWRRLWRDRAGALSHAHEQMRKLDVRPLNPSLPIWAFSGGNQQKILLGKWLQMGPRVMVLHEPTQGVDVGAKREIHEIIRRLAESGVAVCICSSDHEELAALCDEIAVLRDGRVTARLGADDIEIPSIIAAMNMNTDRPLMETH